MSPTPSQDQLREALPIKAPARSTAAPQDRHLSPAEEKVQTASITRLEWTLFAFAIAVYLGSRLLGLTRYPPFFFGDEALQGNLVEQLLTNHFRDQTGTLFPPYFLNDMRWAVSLSVYIHLVPVWIFGKSVATIRATTVAVTLLGAVGAAFALRIGPKNRFWWAAPLVLAAMPVFFVHARLGFESAMMVSFFACFLWSYFLYRYRSPRYLLLALTFGAATFYAYTGGQGVMLITGTLLFFSDLPYHLRQRWTIWVAGLLLALLLAVPYIRYRRLHPGVVREQLQVLDSYLTHPIPISKKAGIFGHNYLRGFNPRYWFWPNGAEAPRHRMEGVGFFPRVYLPLSILGIAVCLWNFPRSSAHRTILIAPLGVPFAAAAADLQILRLLAMVVPVTLFVLVAVDQIYRWVRRLVLYLPAAVAVAGSFSVATAVLTARALTEGTTWFPDYGLYGLQWGAAEVFQAIREDMAQFPNDQVLLSSTWANNPHELVKFFLDPSQRLRLRIADIRAWNLRRSPLYGHELFVMTPVEYEIARQSPKFEVARPERVIPYPDGRPGFYFVRVRYTPSADEVFRAELEERSRPVEDSLEMDGQMVRLRHSRIDMGSLPALFDRDPQTLIRGAEANPFVLDFAFPSPRSVSRISLVLGAMDSVELKVVVRPADGGAETASVTTFRHRPPLPSVEYVIPQGPVRIIGLRLEIKDIGPMVAHVEVRDLSIR